MTKRLSLELVPRKAEKLEQELRLAVDRYPQINTINIPDLLRLKIRSWEACTMAKNHFQHAIPHLRSIDYRRDDPSPFVDAIEANQLDEVLIIHGDPPQDMSRRVYPTASVDLIRLFKRYFPNIKVYAALDAYRAGLRDEYEYIQRKLEAGADGFFTQPFFDLRLLEVYADFLQGNQIFWGVSPVLTERSRNYWETRNQVVFPGDFEPTLDWNVEFARKVLAYAESNGFDVYLMPIKVNVETYLSGIFD